MQHLETWIRRFEACDTESMLETAMSELASLFRYPSCALLTITKKQESASYEYLGSLSAAAQQWLDNNAHDIASSKQESHLPILLCQTRDDTQAINGFVLSGGVGGQHRHFLFVELSHQYDAKLTEQIIWFWLILKNYVLEKHQKLFSENCPDETFIQLTSREKECLSWASKGKSSWEVAQILGVTERTVNFHIQNCIVKTDSANRQQAIAKSLSYNVI